MPHRGGIAGNTSARTVSGVTLLAAQVNAPSMDALRGIVDELKLKLPSAVIVLGAAAEDKVNLVAAVSPDLVKKGFHAGKMSKKRRLFAAAAAADARYGAGRRQRSSKLDAALQLVEELVASAGKCDMIRMYLIPANVRSRGK